MNAIHKIAFLFIVFCSSIALADGVTFDARTSRGGRWSDPATWENARLPKAGDRVQVRPGHVVDYDVNSDAALRMVHVGGVLTFNRGKSTRLDVGLLKIQPGQEAAEDGFVCAVHDDAMKAGQKIQGVPAPFVEAMADIAGSRQPALEIGTAEAPLPAGITATIRLVYFDGMSRDTLPAVVDCGGRMDLHGAPMTRTWIKLDRPAQAGESAVTLANPAIGWSVGDHLILTASRPLEYQDPKAANKSDATYKQKGVSGTEERYVTRIEGQTIQLDKALDFEHTASDAGRCEAANLSRNIVIESADPKGVRGHTMYHRNSTGSISYAEFRHLGKRNVLGKYPIHFHLVRDGMRGGGVTGASIWDSENRFMAIHGTDYLLIRDCVGFQCVGHGYFLEDGSEQYNILDRNLGVQALKGKRLPNQVLTFDENEGAGFWWANGRNTLTRNIACENNKYGFRFEVGKINGKPPILSLRQPDGSMGPRDLRSTPFLRFEDNESHSEGLYSFFFGDDPQGSVHGDKQHPFIARNLFCWQTHYALRPGLTHFLMEHLNIETGTYGVYHPDYNAHVYRDVRVAHSDAEPINRGHDDESIQFGSFTYDGLRLENCSGMPLIQLSCTSPIDGQTGHFRNLTVIPAGYPHQQQVIDRGVGTILPDKELIKGVAYYFHEPGRTLRIISIKFPDLMTGGGYKSIPGFTGKGVRAAEVTGVPFPDLLDPIDDLPPATVITSVRREAGKLLVRGVTQDNGDIASVNVNGHSARIVSSHPGVVDWETTLDAATVKTVTASAKDQAGNVEQMPARFVVSQ